MISKPKFFLAWANKLTNNSFELTAILLLNCTILHDLETRLIVVLSQEL